MSRILFVSTCYPNEKLPECCVYLEQQAKALVDIGNTVDILIPLEDKNATYKLKCKPLNGLNIYYVPYHVLRYELLLSITTRDFYKKIYDFIRINKYEIISVHFGPSWILKMLSNIDKKLYIKVIAHYHGLNVWRDYFTAHPFRAKFNAIKHRRVLNKVDTIVGVSDKVCNIIRGYSTNKNIFTVYNGVDTKLFQPLEKKPDDGIFRMICIANLIPTKGHKYLIEAVKKLIDKNKETKVLLTLVDQGPEETKLKELVKTLGIEDNVEFIGHLYHDKVAELLAKNDVFVMPSYYEALGCAYLEAMASKVTVIGCKGQGINEIIIDNINGLLVEPQSSDDVFAKLDYLLNNPARNIEIAQKGYETVVKNFTWKESAKSLDKLYNKLLNK